MTEDEHPTAELVQAVRAGDLVGAELFLAAGADPNTLDSAGQSMLKVAAAKGNMALVQALVEAGADVNLRDPSDATPLAAAVVNGQPAIVRFLLDRGAAVDPESTYRPGWTPLIGASTLGETAIARMLLERGANPNVKDRRDRTPLSEALKHGHHDLARLLRRAGARE